MAKIIDRYNELKKATPLAVVLMKAGDFYETYDSDAQVCHDILGLVLTKRNGKAQLLTGFPKHALEGYLKKLHDAGRATVVCNETNNNSNNNQNNTTMETKNFRRLRSQTFYMYITDMQALVEVKPVREVFDLNNGRSTQTWVVANTDKKVTTNYLPATETDSERFTGKLYKTLDAFAKGEVMTIDELFYRPSHEFDICKGLVKGYCCVNTDEKGAYIWTYEKGEAVKWHFRDHMDEVTWDYKETGGLTVTCDYEGNALPEGYRSSEEVYMYNDYRFIDAEGKEQVKEGVYKRLFLDPDQEVLAEKLQAVLDECKAAGMKVYFSTVDYTLNAVNNRQVRYEYDPEYDEETEAAYVLDDSKAAYTFKNVSDMNSDDPDMKFVIKKKQEV